MKNTHAILLAAFLALGGPAFGQDMVNTEDAKALDLAMVPTQGIFEDRASGGVGQVDCSKTSTREGLANAGERVKDWISSPLICNRATMLRNACGGNNFSRDLLYDPVKLLADPYVETAAGRGLCDFHPALEREYLVPYEPRRVETRFYGRMFREKFGPEHLTELIGEKSDILIARRFLEPAHIQANTWRPWLIPYHLDGIDRNRGMVNWALQQADILYPDYAEARTGRTRFKSSGLFETIISVATGPPSAEPFWGPRPVVESAEEGPEITCPTVDNPAADSVDTPPILPPGMADDILVMIDGPFHVVTRENPQKMMRFPLARAVSALELTFKIDITGCSEDSPNGKLPVCNLAWLCADGMDGCWLGTFAYLNEGKNLGSFRGTSKWGTPNAGKKNTRATTQINDTSRHPALDPGRYDIRILFDGRRTLSEISNTSGFFRSVEVKTPFGKPVAMESFTGFFGFHGRDKGAESKWLPGTTFLNLRVREVAP